VDDLDTYVSRDNGAEELSARALGERLGRLGGVRQHKGSGGRRGWRGVLIRQGRE